MTVAEDFWKSLIARLPCAVMRHAPGTCSGRVHLHHIAEGSGVRSTFAMVPLCEAHHQGGAGLHGMGPKAFIRLYRPPGESEYGILVWMLEDLSNLLRSNG